MRMFIFSLVVVLAGCAGVRVEVKGFSPQLTQRVVQATYESQKWFCRDGVVAERRDARVDVRGARVHTEAAGEFRCK